MATNAADLGLGARIRSIVRSSDDAAPAAGTTRKVDRRLFQAAVVMIPLGIVAIALAWYGASQTPFVFEQIPYLISGGVLGVGLMVTGGLLYIGSWIARLAEQERDEAEKIREVIAGLREDLADVPALSVAAVERVEQVAGKANPTFFWATPTGSMFHRRDCQIVAGRDDVAKVDEAARESMRPCKMCDPLG